jgi:hypothetical protein
MYLKKVIGLAKINLVNNLINKDMKAKIKLMEDELKNCGLLPMFEERVINKLTKEEDYIIFDIFFHRNSLVAQHVALTKKQERSKKIAHVKMEVDCFFSLDVNLQTLHEYCILEE